jgi:DNA-binding beta-propeller fold protein YncE
VLDLGRCGVGTLVPSDAGLAVVCDSEITIIAGSAPQVLRFSAIPSAGRAIAGPWAGAVGLPGGRVLAVSTTGDLVLVAGSTGAVLATGALPLGDRVSGVSTHLVRLDTESLQQTFSVSVSPAGALLGASPSGDRVYTLDRALRAVHVIDGNTGGELELVDDVGGSPFLGIATD